MTATITDLLGQLRSTNEDLPGDLRERILGLQQAVVPSLIELLEDEAAALEAAPGTGWPPVHAVELLVELQASDAIEPMIRAVLAGDWDEILVDRIISRLPELGG